jgi:hypothetical protein
MKKNKVCFLDFLKNIFGMDNSKKNSSDDLTTESFEILKYSNLPPGSDPFEIINNNIDPKILMAVDKMQTKAYRIDKSGIENVECCVCLENNVKMAPLECIHPLCIQCYNKLVENNYLVCPLCKTKMKIITIHKFYAIMVIFNCNDIGIIYRPPIFDEIGNKWIDCEVFYDIEHNHNEIIRFDNTCKRINNEDFVVVANQSQLFMILNSLPFVHIKKLKIIPIDYEKID